VLAHASAPAVAAIELHIAIRKRHLTVLP